MTHSAERRRNLWQILRYLLVGGWNTVLGYGLFAAFTHLLRGVPYGYVPALIASNVIAVTAAFLGYKWFVFRTRGHYLQEWLRTMSVYGVGMLINAALLPPLVGFLRHSTHLGDRSPYAAQACLAVLIVVLSFVGHKHFTFGRRNVAAIS